MAWLSHTAEVLKKLCQTLVWIYGFRNKNGPDNPSWFTAHHTLCHGTSWIDVGLSASLSSHIQWVATNCHHSAEWADIYFSIMHNKKVPAHNTKSCFMIYVTDFVKNSNLKQMQNTLVFYIFSYCAETWKLFIHLKTVVSIHRALPFATLLAHVSHKLGIASSSLTDSAVSNRKIDQFVSSKCIRAKWKWEAHGCQIFVPTHTLFYL